MLPVCSREGGEGEEFFLLARELAIASLLALVLLLPFRFIAGLFGAHHEPRVNRERILAFAPRPPAPRTFVLERTGRSVALFLAPHDPGIICSSRVQTLRCAGSLHHGAQDEIHDRHRHEPAGALKHFAGLRFRGTAGFAL